jgi:hypothetical protein
LTPDDPAGRALARAHRLYAGFVNARARQAGHLFQGRFGSIAMMARPAFSDRNPLNSRALRRGFRGSDDPHEPLPELGY